MALEFRLSVLHAGTVCVQCAMGGHRDAGHAGRKRKGASSVIRSPTTHPSLSPAWCTIHTLCPLGLFFLNRGKYCVNVFNEDWQTGTTATDAGRNGHASPDIENGWEWKQENIKRKTLQRTGTTTGMRCTRWRRRCVGFHFFGSDRFHLEDGVEHGDRLANCFILQCKKRKRYQNENEGDIVSVSIWKCLHLPKEWLSFETFKIEYV